MNCRALLLGIAAFATAICAPAPAAALAAPEYEIKATWSDTHLPPGGKAEFDLWVRNVGDADGEEDMVVKDELPAGLTATAIHFYPFNTAEDLGEVLCSGVGTSTPECQMPGILPPSALPSFIAAPGLQAGEVAQPTGYLGAIGIEVAIDDSVSGSAINTATVLGGGAPQPDSDIDEVSFDASPSPFGIVPGSFEADLFDAPFPSGVPVRQAADHPFELRVNFDLNQHTGKDVFGNLKAFPNGSLATVEATLPRGMIGNPQATPKCDPVKFAEKGATANSTACPPNTQVGYLNVETAGNFTRHHGLTRVAVYNLEPPKGQAADFGLNAGGYVQGHIYPALDPAQNYAIKTLTPNISNLVPVTGAEITFWGVPGDPAHDKFRYFSKVQPGNLALGAPFGGAGIKPLFTNPADCGFDNGGARIRLESYTDPGSLTAIEEHAHSLNVGGCGDPRFRFEPKVSLQPTSRAAGGPTGLDLHLEVPQRNDEVDEASELYAEKDFVKGISTPPIKKAVVRFPVGMTISPSAAQGLGTCSPEQIGLGTDRPVSCPDNSQYGRLVLHTPILPVDAQPEGFIYVAKQSENAFHNFLSLYLVIQEPERGILVKIPGRVDLDPTSGQITTTFDDLPQFPVSDMQLSLKGGVRAALVNPATCGRKTITAEFFSWHDPTTPLLVNSFYEITQKPDGSPCPESLSDRPFVPDLEAGTLNNAAGSFSPFAFRLTRTDDDQEFSQLGVTLPPGLSAKIAAVSECSDAGIAQALSRTAAGNGALEHADPSCPAASLIGSTDVGAGVGVPLSYLSGKVYLAGPYRGAPLSMVVITPAVVGPYDLGVITVRSALYVNPETTQVTVATDPFPLIYQGIPVRIRDIRVQVDRPGFILNPTSCAEKQITARITGTGGDQGSTADDTAVELTERFQAADCASLGFKPRLSFRLKGGTHRGDHPAFSSQLRARPGDANIAAAVVALPRSEFLENDHIGTICTRVQFAADACPAASVYGSARAVTPLLDQPAEGPIVLRSSNNPLPDLVVKLRGKISANLVGRIDSVNGGIRTTFDAVPDVPVTEFTLRMQGGKKGLFVNSRNLCLHPSRADVRFTAQSGRRLHLRPLVRNGCNRRGKAKRRQATRRG